MIPKRGIVKKDRRLEDLTDSERDALFGVKQSFNTTWTSPAQMPTSNRGNVNKISRVDDQLVVGDGIPYALWEIDNYQGKRRLGFGVGGIGTRGWFTDSDLPVPDIGYQLTVFNGGVFTSGSIVMQRSELSSPIDGMWAGDCVPNGLPSIIEWSRFKGPYYGKYQGFLLREDNYPPTVIGVEGTVKRRMTSEELSARYTPFVANTAVAAGKVIVSGKFSWQVAVAGTTGANTTGWPTTPFSTLPSTSTAQPYVVKNAAGTATGMKVIALGEYTHSDGLQTLRPGLFVYRNIWVEGFMNSCVLIQSNGPNRPTTVTPPAGLDWVKYTDENGDKNRPNVPCGATWDMNNYGVKILSSVLRAQTNQWIYVNSNGGDSEYGGVMYGLYRRNKATGEWSYWPTVIRAPGKDTGPPGTISRPWGVTVLDTHFKDRAVDTTNYGTRRDPTMLPYGQKPAGVTAGPAGYHGAIWTCNDGYLNLPHPVIGNVSNCRGDFAAYVRSEKERNDGYAAQLNPDGSTNFAVLEKRYASGLFPGACDARSWIVWAGNYDDRGKELFPMHRNSYGAFDAQGYYQDPAA